MACVSFIIITQSFSNLGTSSGIISVLVTILICANIISIKMFNFHKQKGGGSGNFDSNKMKTFLKSFQKNI